MFTNVPITGQLFGALALSVAISLVLTRFLVGNSYRLGLVSQPTADRWHKVPTPNTGGIAAFLASTICYWIFAPLHQPYIAAAAAGIGLLGFLDDRLQLRPLTKLLGQSACAAVVLYSGVTFHATAWHWMNVAIAFVWIVGITNAMNLIDNMDGLCAGVVVIIALFRCGIALSTGNSGDATLLLIVAGGYLGFLFFNYKSARIFMGDTGSLFAGFLLATLTIASPVPHTKAVLAGLMYPALTFLYPIFDTVLVSILRRAAGGKISVGGRDHSSHRMVSLGLSEQRAVWLLWGLTALGSTAGLLTFWLPIGVHVVAALLLLSVAVFGVFLSTLISFELPDHAPVRAHGLRKWVPSLRAGVVMAIETSLCGVALLAAFLVRWEDGFLGRPLAQFWTALPVFLICQFLSCVLCRTFSLGWRWFSSFDLMRLGQCAIGGTALSLLVLAMTGVRDYSRGVMILYAILFFSFTVGLRAGLRFLWQSLGTSVGPSGLKRRAAVVGFGANSAVVIAFLQNSKHSQYLPSVILDPDPAADGHRVYGVPVRAYDGDLRELLTKNRVEAVVILEDIPGKVCDAEIVRACQELGLDLDVFHAAMSPWTAERFATA